MKRVIIVIFAIQFTYSLLYAQKKVVFIILDGIPADVIESVNTPTLDEIASEGGYTRAYTGGIAGGFSETPTISAVGYNSLLTGTWANKHNVWGNSIKDPNYNYWNIFRIVKSADPKLRTAIFSTWLDNRTKLIGEGLEQAGGIHMDYAFDGFEHDTVNFPHTEDRSYINNIDEHVSKEAGRYLLEHGPDLSWVYLEFTDDIGHLFGDSPQMEDAVKKADNQVRRIWEAVKVREKEYKEDWMILITTDHGRDKKTGKGHGGQSERERTIWIITNSNNLNESFYSTPSKVDIMPSLLTHMKIEVPKDLSKEIDGVSFIGEIFVKNLSAEIKKKKMNVSWDAYQKEGSVKVFITSTDNFKEGKQDSYIEAGEFPISAESCQIDMVDKADYFKILLEVQGNFTNTWIINN